MNESALVRKLRTVADLSPDEVSQLDALVTDVGATIAKRDIISEGDRPQRVHLILEGWAARYKILPNGSRQILAILTPGDFCDLHVTILGEMDHGIAALSHCKVAYIEGAQIDKLTESNNRLARALWWVTLVDEGVLRAWIVNTGRRDAYERIAHFLCEMHAKMKMIGLVQDGQLALPLTQDELADVTGLTAVHVNRTLQRLRGEDLIEIGSGRLTVLNVDALRKAAGFNPNYLHIKRRVS